MTWPVLRFDQQDLEKLCRISPLHESEYHAENILYGFDCLLRSYADLPEDEPFPWAMEHAIRFDDPQPIERDVQTRLPIILAVTEAQADILRQHNPARVVSIGSAFFYMRALYDQKFPESFVPARAGTLVFPDKSVVGKDVDYDRQRFAENLAALPEEFQPVAVSIFWKDYLRGTHRAFEQAGLKTVTSGYFCDPLFFFRQYDLCRQFKYALANDISSSFCFSVLSGCKFMYLPTGALQVKKRGVVTKYDEEPTLTLPSKRACVAASPYPPAADNGRQLELAELYSGLRDVRSPEFFRELFEDGRKLLRGRPVRQAQFGPKARLDELATWLPFGVDPGGWTYDQFGITVPDAADNAVVRLHLHLPYRALSGRADAMVLEVAGKDAREFPVRPGFWTLDIPARPASAVSIRWPWRAAARPASRGMRLLQISSIAGTAANVRWQKHSFASWCRTMGSIDMRSLLKQMAISWAGDALRMVRGSSLPSPRRLPASIRSMP